MFDSSLIESSDEVSENEELHNELLLKTVELLKEGGPSAITMRRLASECDTSTHMIYKLFEGKRGLIEEIYKIGRKMLLKRYKTVSKDQPLLQRIYEYTQVYRGFALEFPELYEAIHSSSAPQKLMKKRVEVFEIFREAVEEGMEAGYFHEKYDPVQITSSVFAAAHGAISLKISGFYEDQNDDPRYQHDEAVWSVLNGYSTEDQLDYREKFVTRESEETD